jgi:hypothetical protein
MAAMSIRIPLRNDLITDPYKIVIKTSGTTSKTTVM